MSCFGLSGSFGNKRPAFPLIVICELAQKAIRISTMQNAFSGLFVQPLGPSEAVMSRRRYTKREGSVEQDDIHENKECVSCKRELSQRPTKDAGLPLLDLHTSLPGSSALPSAWQHPPQGPATPPPQLGPTSVPIGR